MATDWIAIDPARVTQDKFSYDTADNTLTVNAGTGLNNVCVQLDCKRARYTVDGQRKYLVVVGENLSRENGASYLWWLNGENHGTQVKPDYAEKRKDGQSVFAWDITKSGLDTNCRGDRWSAEIGTTCFGLTSTTGSSTLTYIGFVESVEKWLQGDGIAAIPSVQPARTADVYNLAGQMVRKGVLRERALEGLPGGIYIVDKKKVYVR